jgi:hypothetical protein
VQCITQGKRQLLQDKQVLGRIWDKISWDILAAAAGNYQTGAVLFF